MNRKIYSCVHGEKKTYVAEVWALQRTHSAVRLTSAAVWSLVSSRDM